MNDDNLGNNHRLRKDGLTKEELNKIRKKNLTPEELEEKRRQKTIKQENEKFAAALREERAQEKLPFYRGQCELPTYQQATRSPFDRNFHEVPEAPHEIAEKEYYKKPRQDIQSSNKHDNNDRNNCCDVM